VDSCHLAWYLGFGCPLLSARLATVKRQRFYIGRGSRCLRPLYRRVSESEHTVIAGLGQDPTLLLIVLVLIVCFTVIRVAYIMKGGDE